MHMRSVQYAAGAQYRLGKRDCCTCMSAEAHAHRRVEEVESRIPLHVR